MISKDKKLKIYEKFFHKINLYCVAMNNEKIKDAIHLIDMWSYAHRMGNGQLSYKEQRNCIESCISKMDEF